MRDNLKNSLYFKNYINESYKRLNKRYIKFNEGLIKSDRVKIVKRDMAMAYKNIIIAKYSQGDNMFSDEVYTDYKKMITLMNENWEKNSEKFVISKENQITVLDQYIFSSYIEKLETISLGILLNVPTTDMKLLGDLIDRDNVKDFLLEYLLKQSLNDRPKIQSESYKEYFHINERFFRLKDIITLNDKAVAQQEIKLFLEKDWKKAFDDTPFFQAHKSIHDIYVGYWCFVAAAIVKIKGLDDSSFRNNQYYPKDLV